MDERNGQGATVIELMLREPEIVAWLEDYRPAPGDNADDTDDDGHEPPAAA